MLRRPWLTCAAVAAVLMSTTAELVLPLVYQVAFDDVIPSGSLPGLIPLATVAVAGLLMTALGHVLIAVFIGRISSCCLP